MLNRPALAEALLYSIVYAGAVAADHLSTLLVQSVGGFETNPAFRTNVGELAGDRAILVMVALLPLMLALITLARHRIGRTASKPNLILRRLVGSTPSGPLLLPVAFVFVKVLAALSNVALFYTGVSASDLAGGILEPFGLGDPRFVYLLVAAAFLTLATAAARPVVTAWIGRMSRGSADAVPPATAIP